MRGWNLFSHVWLCFCRQVFHVTLNHLRFRWFCFCEERNTSITKSQRSRAGIPSMRKMRFVSCTSNLLVQMYDFQKRTEVHLKSTLSLQDLTRSQSLETVPVCIVWLYFPHDKIVCIQKYDEYMKSIDSGVCHKLWSTL